MVFLFRLLGRLPLPLLHPLGALAGWLTYLLSPTYRRHLQENIRQAGFGDDVRRAAIPAAGRQMLEILRIWSMPLERVNAQIVETRGWEHIEAAQRAGKGILFLTPHLGCFEITAQYYSAFGDIAVLYRPPKRAFIQEMILAGRQREKLHLAPADVSGVRALIKALRKGQAVGMLPDQAPKEGEGAWVKFFGRYAYTMTLAARLSETGATTLMAWGERLPGGRGYCLHFRPPQTPLAGDTLARAQQINQEIEALIRECPGQYLWGYNRYKRPAGADAPPADGVAE